MTEREAREAAARLGLSTWVVEVIAVGRDNSHPLCLKCVGFEQLDLPLGEAERWEDAFAQAARLIFSA